MRCQNLSLAFKIQLMVCFTFLWVIRFPKQHTWLVCSQVVHQCVHCPTPLPDLAYLDVIPVVQHFLRPACHASEDHVWWGQESLMCFEAFETLPQVKIVLRVRYCRAFLEWATLQDSSSKGCQQAARCGMHYCMKGRQRKRNSLPCVACCKCTWPTVFFLCQCHVYSETFEWENGSWLSLFFGVALCESGANVSSSTTETVPS